MCNIIYITFLIFITIFTCFISGNDHENSDDRESNLDFGDEDQFDPEKSNESDASKESNAPSAIGGTDSVDDMNISVSVVETGRNKVFC